MAFLSNQFQNNIFYSNNFVEIGKNIFTNTTQINGSTPPPLNGFLLYLDGTNFTLLDGFNLKLL